MPKYMLLIGQDRVDSHKEPTATDQRIMEMYREWIGRMMAAGKQESSHKLFNDVGYRIRKSDDGAIVDGPYSESKELIGGYFVIESKDYAEAMEWARQCPSVHHENCFIDVVEVEY